MAEASLARASITPCPACDSQLVLPEEAVAGSEVLCPACEARFAFDAVSVTRLPVATLLPASQPAAAPLADGSPPEPPAAAPEQELAPGVFGDSGFEGLPAWSPPSKPDSANPEPRPLVADPTADEPPLAARDPDAKSQPDETPTATPAPTLTPTLADWLKPTADQPPTEAADVDASKTAENERSSEVQSLLDQLRGLPPSGKSSSDSLPSDSLPSDGAPAAEVSELSAEQATAEEPTDDDAIPASPGATLDLSTPPLPDFAMPTESLSAATEPTPMQLPDLGEPRPLGLRDESLEPTSSGGSWKLGRMLAVTAGALAGVGLGYGLLLLIGGPAYDTLGLMRPDTAASLPPAAAPSADDADPGSRFVADAQQATFESPEDPLAAESPADELTPPAPFATEATPLTPSEEVAAESGPAVVEPAVVEPSVAEPPVAESPVAEPPAAQEPEPAAMGIAGAPVYSADQLAQALAGADQARADLAAHSLAEGTQLELVGRSYAKLCEVAQVLSFLDDDRSHPNMFINRLEAQDLYSRLLRYAHAREDSRKVATRWLNWPDRPHGGVFFSGIPVDASKAGSVYEYRFELAGGAPVAVLTEKPIRVARFDGAMAIGIVGCVIEAPAERVDGYTGSAPRAVWVAHTIPLGNPEFE